VTLASDLDPSPRVGPVPAPAAAIPAQAGPALTISLTDGCETPMDALKTAPPDRPVRCHPCDEAIVRLLIARVRRPDDDLTVTTAVPPGTLCLG
jgi:hypothetical protein